MQFAVFDKSIFHLLVLNENTSNNNRSSKQQKLQKFQNVRPECPKAVGIFLRRTKLCSANCAVNKKKLHSHSAIFWGHYRESGFISLKLKKWGVWPLS